MSSGGNGNVTVDCWIEVSVHCRANGSGILVNSDFTSKDTLVCNCQVLSNRDVNYNQLRTLLTSSRRYRYLMITYTNLSNSKPCQSAGDGLQKCMRLFNIPIGCTEVPMG